MKFLIVGLGSMGKRRIRNLQYLGEKDIIGFDLREDRRNETEEKYGIKTFKTFETAMKEKVDALIISLPPDLHMQYAIIAAKNNKHFFTEASVVDEGMDELIKLCKSKNIVAAPSCTMRFQQPIKKIKELVESKTIGNVCTFTYHSGQYLPDWHPWEDYRKFYVSKKETGACREIVAFELVWLTWVFGNINKVSCFKDKLTKLDVDIDDAYQILMRFKNNILGHMLVDVISRVPYRTLRILGEDGIITWNWGESVKVYTAKNKKWNEYKEEKGTTVKGYAEKIKEEPYIEEIKTFVKAVKGEIKYPYTFEEDKKVLSILYDAEKSSSINKHISGDEK